MASYDIAQLADALANTHVGDGELSFKGLGLKLDDAASVEEVVREIERHQCLRALCLEGNTVGVDAARAIAKALEKKDLLQRCYWSDMFTGRLRSEIPTALRLLGSALMSAGVRLTELDLSDNAFGPDGVKGIEQLLKSPSCYTLRELKLNNCGIGVGGGKILAEALIEGHRQSTVNGAPLRLRVFVAGRNRLENDGAHALAKAFQLMGSLEEVHMPQNGISYAGVMALASAARNNPDLRVLNFNDNTFTKKGTLAMAQALRHLRNVEVVNFGDCLVRCEGAVALAGVLREGLPVLRELNLSFGEITEAAALVVARAVKDKPHMETLDLNGNCLGEEGCEVLREVMENMDKADMLASLSDDEGEPEEEEEDEDCDEEEDDDDDDDDDDEKASAFEMLSELCENLDNARDLMVLGGLQLCVSQYLCHAQSGLRWRAAELIASCAQNMPQVQIHLLSIGALPKLLHLTDSDPHPTVRVKALYAVSCLVREQEAGLQAFLSHDGFSVLMRGMQSENEKLRTKSAFLLLNLLTSNPEQKVTVVSMGMVQQLVSVLHAPHSPFHEHVLGALCCLVEDCPQGLKDCKDPALGLEEFLRQRSRELHGKEESQEELDFCERLRVICFPKKQSDDNGMDR